MDSDFSPQPHKEAVALIAGKPVVAGKVFRRMLPELRARVFTISGIAGANALQRVRDAVAAVPQGDQTWDQAKAQIVDELDPYLGDGAAIRAEMILRVNGFQAFSASVWRVAQADEDTTHLQYLHGECRVPTESHIALNGVVLPKDDAFWDDHYGPWGHLGCVCYARPMNPDLVADERAKDADENPEDANVIEGPALRKLNEGTLTRGGRTYDVSAPDGPDAFKWHPDNLRIPLKELEAKYDPQVWGDFQTYAQNTMLSEQQSLWDWLKGTPDALINIETGPKEGIDEYEHANVNQLSADSQRLFAGGQKAIGRFQSIWGAALETEVLRSVKDEWSAQIAAAATGRKPLFHESIGDAAPQVAAELRKFLPASVEVRATASDIFVYRPEALEKFADDTKPLWPQVQAHANDGIWLGYGANFPADQTVVVKIIDPSGKTKSGFRAPIQAADKFADERAHDFTLATGIKHTGVVVK